MAGFNRYYYLEGVRRGKPEANEMPIKDFLEVFFKRCHIDYNPYEQDIKLQWEKITGKLVKHYTEDLYLNKGVLYVKLSSPVDKSELLMVKDAVKNKINRNLNQDILQNIVIL